MWNSAERDRTAREFEEALSKTGLSMEELRRKTGLDENRFLTAFTVQEHGVESRDIAIIRDILMVEVKKLDACGRS